MKKIVTFAIERLCLLRLYHAIYDKTNHAIFIKMSLQALHVSRVSQYWVSLVLLYFRWNVERSPVLILVVTLKLFMNLSVGMRYFGYLML